MHIKNIGKHTYHCALFALERGATSEGRDDISAAMKHYLIQAFPDSFEILEEVKPKRETFTIETPEDKLTIQTQDVKLETKSAGRPRKHK